MGSSTTAISYNGNDVERNVVIFQNDETGLSELQTPLLLTSTSSVTEQENENNNAVDVDVDVDVDADADADADAANSWQLEQDPNTTKQMCGRFVLGLFYFGICVYMVLLMIMGNVMSMSTEGRGGGLCHEVSLCALFVSWGIMATFLGFQGLNILCYKRWRSIGIFLTPLALLILYLIMAYFYLAIRNHIKYGNSDNADDDIDDDTGFFLE